MFVALTRQGRRRVTSIARQWDGQEEVLREMAAGGELICPGCEQSLRLKAGTIKRRHFAHRTLADCPLEHQSAEVLEAKALLYWWLDTKFPNCVQLETTIGAPGFERVLDLVVETKHTRKFGYLVFDRQQRERESILAHRNLKSVSLLIVHTASTLKLQDERHVLLTASQRDFIVTSDFDKTAAISFGGHLHFIDTEDSTVSIYRGLCRVHEPNVYGFKLRRKGPLESALIAPKTGEIVFAEDVKERDAWRERQRKPAPVVRPVSPTPRNPAAVAPPNPSDPKPAPAVLPPRPPPTPEPTPSPAEVAAEPEEPRINLNGPFRCEMCGVMTTDWSEATPSAGTCVCRACVKERWAKAQSQLPPAPKRFR